MAERGVYVTHSGPLTDQQRLIVASLAVGAGRPAVIAGLSALTKMGMRGYHRDAVHVLLPWQRRDRNPPYWVAVHRTRHLSRADMQARVAPPYTYPARSLIDAAQWASTDDEAAAIIAAGFHGVHVEIDGGHHTDVRQWWSDMRRQNELWVAGDRVLRFPAFVIRHRPDEWVPQLGAALTADGWHPTT